MKITDQETSHDRDPVPVGFTMESRGRDDVIIRHARTGMGCMNVFFMAWLFGWTIACVFLLRQYLAGGVMEDGDPIPLWFVLIFWGAEIVVACLITYLLFCKKSFRLDKERLMIETDILGWKRKRTIDKNTVRRLVQVKDGGEDDDSFPSWGLKLVTDKKITLIRRQPYEKSLWLGALLSQWAGVEFEKAAEESR